MKIETFEDLKDINAVLVYSSNNNVHNNVYTGGWLDYNCNVLLFYYGNYGLYHTSYIKSIEIKTLNSQTLLIAQTRNSVYKFEIDYSYNIEDVSIFRDEDEIKIIEDRCKIFDYTLEHVLDIELSK